MKSKIIGNISIFVFAIFTLITFDVINITAAPGDLDATFGNGGLVTTPFGGSSFAFDIAIQADGKIVIAGDEQIPSSPADRIVLARYNANGSLDSSFGNGGKVVTSFGFSNFSSAIAIQTDGRIVLSGTAISGANSDFFAARFETTGALDTSFGNNGLVLVDLGSGDGGRDLVIQPDGKIVIVGYSGVSMALNIALARLNADGSLDSTFDGDGQVITNLGAASQAIAVALQADGKIVVAGHRSFNPNADFVLVRFNADGSLDAGFDGDGIVVTSIGNFQDYSGDVAVQPDGKIIAVGETQTGSSSSGNYNFVVVRYNTNGSLDTSFDGDGIVVTDPLGNADFLNSVAIQSDGKIVAAGSRGSDGNEFADAALVRYNSNGSLDASFGSGGIRINQFGSSSTLLAVAIQPDGKIVASGGIDENVSVARYVGDAVVSNQRLFDFDGDGKADISIFRPSVGEWWYLRSSDGANRAFTFGSSADKITPADFTGDGKTDIALFRPSTGEWFILRSEDASYFSFPFGASEDIPLAADFDGDSKADAGVFRSSSSTWFINRSTGGTIIRQYGASGDFPVSADYDGDGKADIAVFRPSSGEWWIQRSFDESTIVYQFGSSTDKPVKGDYTGDGKTDVGFYRPATGEWFVLRSEDLSFYSFRFGNATDTPAPADYDGDGKTDAAVFRNGTWYLLQSTNGVSIQQFGLANDKPVPSAYAP